MSGPTAHSIIGASGMHRWENCPGSVKLSEGIRSTTSVYAEEGIKAHDLAAEVLMGNIKLSDLDCDAEMKGAIKVYVDHCLDKKTECNAEMLVEHRFDLSSIHEGCFGTGDCVLYDGREKHLYIYDFKYGAGVPVEAEDNSQLKYYGLGALLSTGHECENITVGIIQPRCEHEDGFIREHTIDILELTEFARVLNKAAAATRAPDAPLKEGSWCRFCPAKAICPEFREKANIAAARVFTPAAPYDVDKLAETLVMLPSLKAWLNSLEEFAITEMKHGVKIPGYKLVDKRANRKWIDEVKASEVLQEKYKIEEKDAVVKKLITPAQMEKLLPKGAKKDELFTSLFSAESSGVTLAPESDRRLPANVSPADVFKKLETEDQPY